MNYSHRKKLSMGKQDDEVFCEKGIITNYARQLVRAYAQMGILIEPEKCEICGRAPRNRKGEYEENENYNDRKMLVAHHDDYFKPLSVTWVCHVCHGKRHKELNKQGKDPSSSFYQKILQSQDGDKYLSRLRRFYIEVAELSSELFCEDSLENPYALDSIPKLSLSFQDGD